MIQDIHAHLFHPRWYPSQFVEAMLRDFQSRQQRSSQVSGSAVGRQLIRMMTDDTGDNTVRLMDKVGIEKRAILVLDWGVELGEPEKTIREIHVEILGICRKFADRFVGFAGIDPRRSDAVQIVTWAFDELGAKGLKLHPTGGWKLTDSQTCEVIAVAAERKFPVLIHLGKTVDVLSDSNAQPAPFLELASRFTEIPFIAGHSGFDLWETFVRGADRVPPNVFFDVSGWQERIQGSGANIISDLKTLAAAFPNRVCFGTDSPFYSFNLISSEQRWLERINSVVPWTNLDHLLKTGTAQRDAKETATRQADSKF